MRDQAQWNDMSFSLLIHMVILLLLASVLLPFLYIISISFRPQTDIFGAPHWIPTEVTLRGWRQAWDIMSPKLRTSLFVALGTSAFSMLITVPGAYVFARQEFPGRRFGFYAVLTALFFPYLLLVIPISDTWFKYELYDTIPGLWIAYQVFITPFAIWILRDFFEALPSNLEEAAQVYGCTQFSAFVRVILPISLPAIVSVAFLAFLVGWNDFIFANMLTGSGARTAVVSLFMITNKGEALDWSRVMAMTLMIGIPPSVLYMFSRRYLAEAFAVTE